MHETPAIDPHEAPAPKRPAQLRECVTCGHRGSDDDASETGAYCGSCGVTVSPIPAEDLCPECGQPSCMRLACPECGCAYLGVDAYGEDDPW